MKTFTLINAVIPAPGAVIARQGLGLRGVGGSGGQHLGEALRGAIIALGNFDGFHLGHQAVAGEARDWARAEGRPAIIATFDPHPMRHFRPDTPSFRLTTLDQRQRLFAQAGADAMLVFQFGAELASTTAEDFPAVMQAMAQLRAPIDAFFTAVQVNADNEIIRRNRLNLLHRIRAICSGVADLTKIEG